MKNAKRALALLLCLVMVLSYVPVHAHAADGATNLSMSLSDSEVNVGDTFTITVSYGDMTISSIGCPLSYDTALVEFVSAVGCDHEYPEDVGLCGRKTFSYGEISTPEEAKAIGQIGFAVAGMREVAYNECDIYTATFKAIAPGTVTFTLTEDSAGADGYKGVAQVATVTINGATTPSCEHTNTKAVSNNNGTHNIVCANETCGATVTENVTCSGGTATCTAKAECSACGAEYGEVKGHKDDNKDHACDNGCDVYQGTHADGDDDNHTCDYCGGAVNGEDHTPGEPVVNTEESKDATCTEEGTLVTETFCTECGAKLSSKTESIPAGTGCELGDPTYNWSNDYSTCTAEVECQHGTVHKTETVDTTYKVTTEGTCQTAEVVTYYADFTNFEDTSIPVTGEKNANNHVGSATISYRDNNDGTHTAVSTYECGHSVDGNTADCSDGNDSDELCDSCGNNLHVCAHDHYNITDTTHQSICSCGNPIGEAVPHECDHDMHKCVCGKEIPVYVIIKDFPGQTVVLSDMVQLTDADGDGVYTAEIKLTGTSELIDISLYHEDGTVCPAHPGELMSGYGEEVYARKTIVLEYKPAADKLNVVEILCDHQADEYVDNEDGTHTVKCECGYIINDEESHSYNHQTGDFECECGAKYTGWSSSVDGEGTTWTCYVLNGNVLHGWNEVEGSWYYFSTTSGQPATGLTRVPYPTEEINGKTYVPDAEALAYCESKGTTFIDATEAWFCFADDGKFVYNANGAIGHGDGEAKLVHGMLAWHPGLLEVADGVYVYFIGDTVNGGNKLATGDTYITKNNGNTAFAIGDIYNFVDGKLSGANGIVDGKYYENSRLMIGNGLTEVGENYIYVTRNGELIVNADYYVPANDLGVVEGMYSFDENGYMVNPEMTDKDGVYYENGAYYYYENGKIGYNKGLIKVTETWHTAEGSAVIEDVTIYVRSNGQLATGYYYVTNVDNYDGSVASGTKLLFSYAGELVTMNGIRGDKYYVDSVVAYGAGVVEYNGGYIYVKSDGTVVKDKNYWITNVGDSGVVAKMYTFDANGFFTPEFAKDAKNGVVDGYYYENGSIVYGAGLIEYNGGYIYVRSNGMVATGKYWITNTNDLMDNGYYTFGEDGMMIIN